MLAASHEVTPGSPRCVSIWTPESYEQFTERTLRDLNPLSPTARELKRFFFNSSFDTELDSANRVMIPPPLMRYASLDREVVVTGSGECIEIWDRRAFDGYREDVLTRVPDLAASLSGGVA